MPEAAEVKIFTDQLTKEFGGQALQNLEVVGGRFLKEPIPNIKELNFPLKKVNFNSKGKFLYWTFGNWQFNEEVDDNIETVFFITLGMAASFGPQSKHSALKFTFDKGDIYFNDIRHFGTFKISDKVSLEEKLFSLGWDALKYPTMPEALPNLLKSKHGNKTIAETLLNQKVFAGVGNYIRSEALYVSGIHPLRLVKDLSTEEISTLSSNIVKVVQEAYAQGGATIATFKDMYGNTGKFFDKFKVYSKKIDPNNKPVKKITAPDGRSVFYVEGVQY